MSVIATALKHLIAAGVSGDELVRAVAEIEAEMEAARPVEDTRSTAAKRQARYRERVNERNAESNETSQSVTRDVTRNESVTPPPPPYKTPQTPKINPPPHVCERRAREGWHRLPENWAPTRALPAKTQAKTDIWPPGALADELAAFHRWAANAKNENGKGRKLDWDKAWVNWLERRHDEQHGKANRGSPTGRSLSGTRPSPTLAILRAATAEPGDPGDYEQAGFDLPASGRC